MKHYLKKIIISTVILAISSLALGAGKTDKTVEKADAVASVQIGTIKTPADKMGHVRLEKLTKCLEDVMQGEPLIDGILPEEGANEPYIVVRLRYESGKKDTCRFYSIDDKWYMESPDGNVYGGADFITDYVQISVNEAVQKEKVVLEFPPEGLLELDGEFGERDWNYFFSENVYRRIASGSSVDEALLSAREELRQKLIFARYAMKNGYELDEAAFQERIASRIRLAESAENYEEVEAAYEAAGLTVADDIRRSAEYYRVIFEAELLYQEAYNSFREGEDMVGGTECWSVGEYWSEYVGQVIHPSITQEELDEINACLNEAEIFCEKHLS